MMKNPAKARRTSTDFRFPRPTSTASFFTMTPALWRPMKAMNRPIPVEMPILRDFGKPFTMVSLTLVRVSRMKRIPSMKMAARATCQEIPMPRTTPKAKNALSPMPGARAMG